MMNDMEAMTSPTDNSATYSLWHIPTSTLLVMTNAVAEVMRRIELATTEGVFLAELMLNVDHDGSLVGKQHLGPCMLDALPLHE